MHAWKELRFTCTEIPDEAVDKVRAAGALGGAGLKAVLLPPSLSLAAMLAHVFGFAASGAACCAGAGARPGGLAGCLGAASGGGRGSGADCGA